MTLYISLCYVLLLYFSFISGNKRYGKSAQPKDHMMNKYGSYQQRSENLDFDNTNEDANIDYYSYSKERNDKVDIISSYTKSFKIKALVALTSGILCI